MCRERRTVMGDFEKEVRINTFASSDVKKLELQITAASVLTKETAEAEIRVEAKNLESDKYTCELREGKLVIAYKMEGVVKRLRFGSDDTKITIYLPAGLTLEHMVLEIGAGSMDLDAVPVSCNKVDVEIGAGKWKAAQLSVSDSLCVEIGAGKAKMKDVAAGSLKIDCGVGSSVYRGRVNGDIKVNCGVGNCSFELDNKESDFNYDVSCALGRVRINNSNSRNFVSRKSYPNSPALGTAVFECGIGSIDLRTTGEGIRSPK